MASGVKCRGCGKKINGSVVRYRTTIVKPDATAWEGTLAWWICEACAEATQEAYMRNRKTKKSA